MESNPELVLMPKSKKEIIKIIKIAKKNRIPLVPYSSQWDFHGSTAALNGGCMVDLRNLNTIEKFRDSFNGMSVDIEPGVTFKQINEHIAKKGYRLIQPLRIPSETSVLSTYYGKNPLLEANKYGYHQDWMILTYQIAISKGQIVAFGSEGLETVDDAGDYPYSPRADLGRMFLGAIGAYGIITRITTKMKYLPDGYDFLYFYGDDFDDFILKIRDVTQSTDAAQTVLITDPKILGTYISKSKNEYMHTKEKLSGYTGIITLAGSEEYRNVEKQDLLDAASEFGLNLVETGPVNNSNEILEQEFKSLNNIGTCFDYSPHLRVEFYTTGGRLPNLKKNMDKFFRNSKVPEENIGFLCNSLELGRTYYCEYDIFYDTDPKKIDSNNLPNIGDYNLRELYQKTYKAILEYGGVINLPRNIITSQLMYPLNPNYYEMMRVLKWCLDPENIMHPSIIFSGEGGLNPKTLEIKMEV